MKRALAVAVLLAAIACSARSSRNTQATKVERVTKVDTVTRVDTVLVYSASAPQSTWPDSTQTTVTIGSATPGAILYIDGAVISPISALRSFIVPAGTVRLQIKAEGCAGWDTTITTVARVPIRIGRRHARCP